MGPDLWDHLSLPKKHIKGRFQNPYNQTPYIHDPYCVGSLIGSVGILIVSVGILIGFVGILIGFIGILIGSDFWLRRDYDDGLWKTQFELENFCWDFDQS